MEEFTDDGGTQRKENDTAGLDGSLQKKAELFLNNELSKHSDIWDQRPLLRGNFFIYLYRTRNWVFNINPSSKRNLIKIPLKEGRTLHHDVNGKNGSGKVFLRAAPSGTGIIAGGPIRSVCEVLGIQDIVAKSLGSANPHNVLKACINGLKSQNSPKILSAIRGKKISEIVLRREAK